MDASMIEGADREEKMLVMLMILVLMLLLRMMV